MTKFHPNMTDDEFRAISDEAMNSIKYSYNDNEARIALPFGNGNGNGDEYMFLVTRGDTIEISVGYKEDLPFVLDLATTMTYYDGPLVFDLAQLALLVASLRVLGNFAASTFFQKQAEIDEANRQIAAERAGEGTLA